MSNSATDPVRISLRAKAVAGAIVALLASVACDSGTKDPKAVAPRERVTPPASSPSIAERRPLTRPDRVIVDNQATGPHRARLQTAIADLKAVSMWRKLTRELFVVELSARPGRAFVPEDAHLADAFRTLDIREEHAGVLCDITFYPTAMSDDLVRWRSYYDRGLISDEPPTVRQLWAAILAHELSHCLKKDNSEPDAQRWEDRALEALRAAGLS